jgi:hypothetical protein
MKKARIQEPFPWEQEQQQQEAPPEVIFKSTDLEFQHLEPKRRVFFDQLEEMVEKCTFTCPPGMSSFLKDPAKEKIRIPNDLDPQRFRGKIFFIDYMNIFPAFQRTLLSREKLKLDSDVWKDTSFQQKIDNLYVPAYRIALLYYAFSLKGYTNIPPTANDWVFLVSQGGQKKCGLLTYESCAFLNGCHVLMVEVPCVDNLNYYPLFTSRDCHLLFEKNEVDDYFLLYCLLYFQSARDKVENKILQNRSTPEESDWLWNQTLVLISNDQYSWASEKKTRVQKLPSPWPTAFSVAFSMGTTTTTPKTPKTKSLRKKR